MPPEKWRFYSASLSKIRVHTRVSCRHIMTTQNRTVGFPLDPGRRLMPQDGWHSARDHGGVMKPRVLHVGEGWSDGRGSWTWLLGGASVTVLLGGICTQRRGQWIHEARHQIAGDTLGGGLCWLRWRGKDSFGSLVLCLSLNHTYRLFFHHLILVYAGDAMGEHLSCERLLGADSQLPEFFPLRQHHPSSTDGKLDAERNVSLNCESQFELGDRFLRVDSGPVRASRRPVLFQLDHNVVEAQGGETDISLWSTLHHLQGDSEAVSGVHQVRKPTPIGFGNSVPPYGWVWLL